MSRSVLSGMDRKTDSKDDMRYLIQPRGAGKSWVFRMLTPPDLVGLPNPWDGKPFQKEIKKGLGTNHLPTARRLRDIALGDIRRLQDTLGDAGAFSLSTAQEWREAIEAARLKAQEEGDPFNVGVEFILYDRLEEAQARGVPDDKLRRFSRVALGTGFLLELAHTQYVEARRVGNPHGYAPLKRTTVMNLDTAVKHLRTFMKDDANTLCMEDITPELALRFRDTYLPSVRNSRSKGGLSAETVAKNVNLLKQMWVWAIERKLLGKKAKNPWEFGKGVRRTSGEREKKRQDYQPHEFSMLLRATERGTKEGDLIRLAIASGCRADELATITADQVKEDGSGFYLAVGKTKNAARFIPVVGEARELLRTRLLHHAPTGRLFPEWPIRPASGKAAAVSQWFTRFRRKQLGKETDEL